VTSGGKWEPNTGGKERINLAALFNEGLRDSVFKSVWGKQFLAEGFSRALPEGTY